MSMEDLFTTPTPDLAVGLCMEPQRLWPIGVVCAPGGHGGWACRSLLARVAQECGRELAERIREWPTARQIGDPHVATLGAYMPTLAGYLIRDGDGRPLRLPSVAEAAHFAELHLLATPVVNVWVRVGPPSQHGDPAAWARGLAAGTIGAHPRLPGLHGAPPELRLTYVTGPRGEARPATSIWPRVITEGTTA